MVAPTRLRLLPAQLQCVRTQTAGNYWPGTPRRIERFTLVVRVERIRIPAAQISMELAESLVAGMRCDGIRPLRGPAVEDLE